MSTTEEAEEPEVRPDCRVADTIGEGNQWVEHPVTEKLLVWWGPCTRCFPDEEIDTEMVVKKRHRYSSSPKLHRPQ